MRRGEGETKLRQGKARRDEAKAQQRQRTREQAGLWVACALTVLCCALLCVCVCVCAATCCVLFVCRTFIKNERYLISSKMSHFTAHREGDGETDRRTGSAIESAWGVAQGRARAEAARGE